MLVDELLGSANTVQGIKSVYGMVEGSYLGFSNLDRAREVALRANMQPFVLAVGTGLATAAVNGRVVNIVKLSGAVCELDAESMPLHHWTALKRQWPYAVILDSVYLVDGCPLVKADLGISIGGRIHVSQGLNGTDPSFLAEIVSKIADRRVMRVPVPPAGEGPSLAERRAMLNALT